MHLTILTACVANVSKADTLDAIGLRIIETVLPGSSSKCCGIGVCDVSAGMMKILMTNRIICVEAEEIGGAVEF